MNTTYPFSLRRAGVLPFQGKTIIDEVEVSIGSPRFYPSGVRYIDGQVFSLEEAIKQC